MKYECPITCHSKDMANVKVFADRQTDRRSGQKLYAPDLSIWGHKNIYYITRKASSLAKQYTVCYSIREICRENISCVQRLNKSENLRNHVQVFIIQKGVHLTV
jgi:hypothetical protein